MQNYFSKSWFPYLCIVILGLAVFGQSLLFDFTYYDDNVLVVNDYNFLKDISNLPQTFNQSVRSSETFYRPFLTISFMFDAVIGGQNPFIYHFTNVLLHVLASCLLFALLITLGYTRLPSLLFSLVFTVHPILTQAVSWIPGRNDSLTAVFIIPAFIFFLKFIEKRRTKDYLLHMLFLISAFFTKESALILVFLFVIYLFITKKQKFLTKKSSLPVSWIGFSAFFILLRNSILENQLEIGIIDALKSIAVNLPNILIYVGKIIIPVNLSVFHTAGDTSAGYGIAALILLIVVLIYAKSIKNRLTIFGLLWFIFFLIPPLIHSKTALYLHEHRSYIPLIGLMIVFLEASKAYTFRKSSIITGLFVISILSFITVRHSSCFQNRAVFWASAVKHSPNSVIAHLNHGAMYFIDGAFDKAEDEFLTAAQLDPNEPIVHYNLGLIYSRKNIFEKAEKAFKDEIEINPFFSNAYLDLGSLYYNNGDFKKAESIWKTLLADNPNSIHALRNLTTYYINLNQPENAAYYIRELYNRGVQLHPDLLELMRTKE